MKSRLNLSLVIALVFALASSNVAAQDDVSKKPLTEASASDLLVRLGEQFYAYTTGHGIMVISAVSGATVTLATTVYFYGRSVGYNQGRLAYQRELFATPTGMSDNNKPILFAALKGATNTERLDFLTSKYFQAGKMHAASELTSSFFK